MSVGNLNPGCCSCSGGGGGGGTSTCVTPGTTCVVTQATPITYSLYQNNFGTRTTLRTGSLTYGSFTLRPGGTATTDWHSGWQSWTAPAFTSDCIFYQLVGICPTVTYVALDASGTLCSHGTASEIMDQCTVSSPVKDPTVTCTPFSYSFDNSRCSDTLTFAGWYSGVLTQ